MIQMKFKQLATVGVCCSMLANSLAGVTAVAETMTVESSPTVESTKENTKETESQANKTEESTAKVKVNKEEAVSEKQEITKKFNYGESLLQPKQISPKATMNFPQLTYQFGFIDETGMRVDASTVHLAYDIWVGESLLRGDWKTLSIEKGRLATTNNNLKEIVYPKQSLNQVSGRDWQYSAANLTFIPPRYYEKMSVYNKNGTFDTAYSFPNINSYNGISSTVHTENDTKNLSRYFELTKSGNQSFIFNESTSAAPADVKVPAYLRETVVDPDNGYLGYGVYDGLDKPVYYYLTNRKVTENFVDATGAKITPPTGFTQGKQTVINSDPYIFKQSGTLPDTYTAGDKTYKFKGWYKGTDATKMETTKTPSYAVTYDDNDDLNVIYEEVVPKTVTVPAVDYLFGFINEKGVYDYDAKLTATITEVSGGTVKNGSAITSVPEGVFQKLTIPSKTLTYTETSPTYYGVTKANVQVPKYYKQPTVKPGSYFTGPVGGYPMATIALQNIANGQKSNASVDGSRFDVVPNESAKPNNYLLVSNSWANDTTKTAFSKALSMTTTVNAPSFFTTEDKMFYFLENRRVTENFVDSNGAKITPPTGFTQGKKTVIDSNDFTYTSDKALPATYSADGKSYRLKGWYKGKDKPATLSKGTPTYKVTYDDNDDLTVVYDEAKVTLLGYTYQFGFVDEAGQLINPNLVNLTYDMWFFEDKVETILEKSVKATNSGNLKEMTIADKVVKEPTAAMLDESTIYSPINLQFTLPKYYETIVASEGSDTNYPLPQMIQNASGRESNVVATKDTFALKKLTDQTFGMQTLFTNSLVSDTPYPIPFRRYTKWAGGTVPVNTTYMKVMSPVYYMVKNRRVTESFVDATGAKITPPTGFTQGNQVLITNDDFTYTSDKALPATYTADGKTYQLKGWYKGKDKPPTLSSGTPTYKVTYDDNDDLTIVYDEQKSITMPGATYQFGFIDDSGKIVDPSKVGLTYDLWLLDKKVSTITNKNLSAINFGNVKSMSIPDKEIPLPVFEDGNSLFSPINMTFSLPKYYSSMTINNGLNSSYLIPVVTERRSNEAPKEFPTTDTSFALQKVADQAYTTAYTNSNSAAPNIKFPILYRRYAVPPIGVDPYTNYSTFSGPVYYTLNQRRITESFVDTTGEKITPPTGFTQGNQVLITNNDFTYTSAKALPASYTADGKTYQLKGWYKGKDKPPTLSTGTPTYKVTYDDNDDLTVVYDEAKVTLPGYTYQFGFVDEAGQLINPNLVNLTYDMWFFEDKVETILEKSVKATNSGDLKEMKIADKVVKEPTVETLGEDTIYSPINIQFTLPKYYETIVASEGSDTNYPLPQMIQNSSGRESAVVATKDTFALKKLTDQTFGMKTLYTNSLVPNTPYPIPFRRYTKWAGGTVPVNTTYMEVMSPVFYMLKNRRITESFVDATGAKITPPTGFTQGKQIVIDSDNFTYTSAKALPTSYTADGKTYLFQGWYKGKTKPNTLTTSTTPTYDTTFDDNDDMTAVYKEASISANLTMRGAVDVIDNGATMEYWEVLLKNTGEAPLTSIKIKPTTEWVAGISAPTNLFILGTGQNAKSPKITKEQWEAGFEIPLDKSLPVGGQLTINLIGTKVTGQPNQVLKAAVEVTGDFSNLSASDTVRIKDLDQETKEPTGEGFISVPTFDFGQVGVASATKQHDLKKAADYYGNGTRNPYVRIKKTQPNWSLTAQLSQPKSVTDSLPTATRLLLGAAPVSSFSNYNQPTELKNAIGTTNAIHLTANNAATSIIANQQFTGSDVYQLDFTFDNIKLEVPANQGTAGQQYQAAVTWNLVTGP
ncbi:WxL domain-containing protein [Enterococcus faecalis]|uniref:WxL domain-containing protein n=1 Tax=Enterococcus faecalis TaxID=1351 RepID=UPI0021DFBD53|nr:WxL domain-containing protein [Enterococcus faecalis]MCU9768557.1 WxL domain-containing protein [Enterococcus faecalis]MCU9799908.1 WxL domain-containing protein [Enterococcus faecalis]MCU9802529.1 WxL domain-containing protein [Enterococcus faecalis]